MPQPVSNKLRVVAFLEGNYWVAQCVEYDICVQGKDLPQARRRMDIALQHEARFTEEKYGQAFKNIDPAPDYFEAMFQATETKMEGDNDFRVAA